MKREGIIRCKKSREKKHFLRLIISARLDFFFIPAITSFLGLRDVELFLFVSSFQINVSRHWGHSEINFICLHLFLLVLAISHPKKIKDSGKPGRSADHNVSSIQQRSSAFPGPVHTIAASSPQRPQSGDTTKLRNGKGDTEANFGSKMPSKHQSRGAMKGKQVK